MKSLKRKNKIDFFRKLIIKNAKILHHFADKMSIFFTWCWWCPKLWRCCRCSRISVIVHFFSFFSVLLNGRVPFTYVRLGSARADWSKFEWLIFSWFTFFTFTVTISHAFLDWEKKKWTRPVAWQVIFTKNIIFWKSTKSEFWQLFRFFLLN